MSTPTPGGNCAITGGYVVHDPRPPRPGRPVPVRRLLQGRAANDPDPRRRPRLRPGALDKLAQLLRRGSRRPDLRRLQGRRRVRARAERMSLRLLLRGALAAPGRGARPPRSRSGRRHPGAGPTPRGNGNGGVNKELVAAGLAAPIYSAAAPGVAGYALRGRARRHRAGGRPRRRRRHRVPRHHRTGLDRGRARPALDRLRPRLPGQRPRLRLLHARLERRDRGRRVHRPLRHRRRRDRRPRGDRRSPTPASPNHHGRHDRLRPRRRPLRRAPATAADGGDPTRTPRTRASCWASCCGSTPTAPATATTRCPRTTRSSASRGATRSTRSACATRSASRSTEPTGRIGIGDVGQYRWEEVDLESPESLRKANFGWDHFEGDHDQPLGATTRRRGRVTTTSRRSTSTRTARAT